MAFIQSRPERVQVKTSTPMPAVRAPVRPTSAPQAQMPASFLDTFDSPGFLRAGGDAICTRSYEDGQFHIRVTAQN